MKNSSGTNFRDSPAGVKRRDALNKNSSGTNFRDSPAGVKRRDALNKTMAHLDRYPNAQVNSS